MSLKFAKMSLFSLMTIGMMTGCSYHYLVKIPFGDAPGKQRTLTVKTVSGGQITCLEEANWQLKPDDNELISKALDNICRSYQNGTLASEQYSAGIVSAPTLLLVSRVGNFLLASDHSIQNKYYFQLVEIIKAFPKMNILCSRIKLMGEPDQPIVRLCRNAFDNLALISWPTNKFS